MRSELPVVALVVDQTSEDSLRFARQVAAELRALGFQPEMAIWNQGDWNPEQLSGIASDRGAVAAITLRMAPGHPVVWIADQVTGKLVRREVRASGTDPDDVLAVRAVELLRASLMELESRHWVEDRSNVAWEVHKVATSTVKVRDTYETMRLAMGLGGALSRGDMSPCGHGFFEFSYAGRRWLGMGMLVSFPFTPSRTVVDSGEVELWFGLVGVSLKISFLPPNGSWRLDLDAGVGGQLTIATGKAEEGFDGHTELERSLSPYLRLGVSRRIHRNVSMRADVMAAFAVPPIRLHVGDDRTLVFGLPWVGIALGFDLGW